MNDRTVVPPIPEARVLVVDDEPIIRSALVLSLISRGYRVDEAGSGRQALRMLELTPYDLMVLDMRMPGIDGVEVMRRAREMRPELLIIVLTGHAELESAIAAIESRAVSYLRKPVSVHDIAAAVASALQQRAEKLRLEHLLGVMDQTLRALRGLEVPGESPSAPKLERFLRVGPVTLDREKRLAVVGGTPARTVELTENETAILAYLMEHPDQVISGRELVRAALGYSDVEEREARSMLRPQIFRLRHKLEADPDEPRLIRTMRGRGYLFAC